MQTLSTRHAAVQVVTVASATLSASYYASQAPDLTVSLLGFAVAPIAIGLGVTAFALDLVKPQMLRVLGTAGSGFGRRLASGVVFAILFIASMIAVDGMLMRLRSDWAATRGNDITAHADARKEMIRLETEIAALGEPRPVAVVQAEVSSAKIDMAVWRRSKECSDIRRDDTKAACAPILALYKERGSAARKAELEPQLVAARHALLSINPPKSADPQAEALAETLGHNSAVISYGMVAILGFAVELVACFGVWILSPPPPVARAPTPGQGPVPGSRGGLERLTLQIVTSGGKLVAENRDIAKLLGVTEGCASKWRKLWRDASEISESKIDGKLIIELGRKRLRAVIS